ncbi:FHA domain-containing protein [Luteimonas sp. BDR2-5]|uniref:FHA domain-containing protein n=1 Tax=Proluteimonas luteida TaxID=2878685 RepID=UPI001E53353C|nr:FHA domain-containing protein [Luteimonas sp. BDR2-5]MCD9026856.1 FHA domain-containing protein [Luteimonas sp. BDR2-5]
MNALKLRFPAPGQPDLPLDIGMHRIGRDEDGALVPVDEEQPVLVCFCVDRRGVWLNVSEGVPGVHVNGRQVRRLAMLRTGDAVYVDGYELRLVAPLPVAAQFAPMQVDVAPPAGDPRIVLRGVGGHHHGRSFILDRPVLVGRHADADIHIDDPAFADRHARLERVGPLVQLIDLDSAEGSVVNGETVRDAVLQAGDQVVFDAHHRFVVEAPSRAITAFLPAPEPAGDDRRHVPSSRRGGALRLPWLLLAALLLAGLLALLLLFGAG